jgi:CRP/FNR family cyclic AMP-dependent transcriptional regulator
LYISAKEGEFMNAASLGREYQEGEIVFRQGSEGNCMYVILEGQVEVVSESNGHSVRVAVLNKGDFFGEMAIFQKEARTATIRTLTNARLLTVDKKAFLSRIEEDPSLAFRIVETLSRRIGNMTQALLAKS